MKIITNFLKSFTGIIIFFGLQILTAIIIIMSNINKELIYILMEVITVLLLIVIHYNKIKKDFKDFDSNYKSYLKIVIKPYLIGLLIMIISNLLISRLILIDNLPHNEEIDRLIIFKYPLFSIIGIIITGPFIEEVTFRLGFKQYINNKTIYYLLSTLIFASMHVLNGISSPVELVYFIPYSSVSFAFSYILDKTDNIFSTTILHMLHNTISLLLIISVNLIGG